MLIHSLLLLAVHPCEPCHQAIVQSYLKTAMARTSGKVVPAEHLPAAPFLEPKSQARIEVTPDLKLAFAKDDFTGSRLLEFFIGSGRVGRSYLFRQNQYWFQSPVSFFTEARHWQISPGFGRRPQLELTRQIEPSCFNCHTTSTNPLVGGIGCERCHGDVSRHEAILHPGKLPARERDSICAQCHLTGAARVARFQPRNDSYKPGLRLSDFSAIFVGGEADGIGVTSHFERMAASACARATGDRFTCTTCHDPHSEPAAADTYFNAKCQGCHRQRPCTQALEGNCIQCHMPKGAARGVDHSSYTDHSIPRRPGPAQAATSQLRPFWAGATNDRDLAVALAVLGRHSEARPGLQAAVQNEPKDLLARSQLAQLADREGREAEAQAHYEAILKLDPSHATAAANLGVIRIRAGQTNEAIRLWRLALAANPAQTGIRMNVAQALFRAGRRAEAASELELLLNYDPDQPAARRMLRQLHASAAPSLPAGRKR